MNFARAVFEVGVNEGLAGGMKLRQRGIELFYSVLPCAGVKQSNADIALFQRNIVCILQAVLGYGVEKVFPLHEFQIQPAAVQAVVFCAQVLAQGIALGFEFRGGGDEDADGLHRTEVYKGKGKSMQIRSFARTVCKTTLGKEL